MISIIFLCKTKTLFPLPLGLHIIFPPSYPIHLWMTTFLCKIQSWTVWILLLLFFFYYSSYNWTCISLISFISAGSMCRLLSFLVIVHAFKNAFLLSNLNTLFFTISSWGLRSCYIYANPWIPVHTGYAMGYSCFGNCA